MRESSQEITQLCESWRAKLADSTKDEPIEAKATWKQAASISFVLRAGAETAVAAHFVMPGTLEPPGSLIERGLDFCEATRALVNVTRALNITHAFVTDLYRSYLYDVRADELLLHADAPADFDRDFVDVLSRADIERGAVAEVRRQPRSYAARQLRQWCRHWCAHLCAEGQALPEETAFLAIDRLLVLGFLLDHNVLTRTQWDLRKHLGDLIALAFSGNPAGCGQQLTALFRDLWQQWNAGLFAPAPLLEDVLAKDTIAVPLLKEFALLSRTKFTIATILESFNYGEPAEKARVRMVPEATKEREIYLAKCTLDTIDSARVEIDVDEEGYRAIFQWFDRLVALYERLEVQSEAQAAREPVPEDLDLLAWAERDAAKPKALADKHHHAAERGLTIYYATARQLRTARLMLYLHLISRYHQSKEPFARFPNLDDTFKARQGVLKAGRNWANQPMSNHTEESEVV